MKSKSIMMAGLLVLSVTACQKNEIEPNPGAFKSDLEQSLVRIDGNIGLQKSVYKGTKTEHWMVSLNKALLAHNLQLEKIELLGADRAGNTVYFKDTGNKKLSSVFVPNDPRNETGTAVPYIIDGTELGTSSGMSEFETYVAIVRSMDTWGEVTCSSGLEIPLDGVTGFDVGYVQYLLGFGGIAGYFPGTIVHAGVLPSAFFDAVDEDGGNNILGVTFTFDWIEDIDQDGKGDVAIKEIYMNDGFNWQDEPNDVLFNDIYDFETVILHESGHGLCQGHFGKAIQSGNGKLHFSPAALMNSGYSVGRREVTETDLSGHCGIWASWPN